MRRRAPWAEQPYIGPGRPFGGLHPNGVNVLFADGRVTFLSADIDPLVWEAHARINVDEWER
jgi:prepilin-type processing-associated H-X9-DG protein